MGRSITPKYRMEMTDCKGVVSLMCWKGAPNKKGLEQWVTRYHDSLKVGGVNEHLSKSLGFLPLVYHVKLVRQADNVVVSCWKAPMFMVI